MGVKKAEVKDEAKTEKDSIKSEPKYKRVLVVKQTRDDKFIVDFRRVTAKQYLRPMLSAAEKELHCRLARHEI